MLRDLLSSICEKYLTYYKEREDFWKKTGERQPTVSKDYEVHDILVKHFPKKIESILSTELNTENLKITGSDGQGIITPGPWVNIRIPELAQNTTEGFYIVYLFSLDMSRIYLSLALGSNIFKEKKINNDSMLSTGKKLNQIILNIAFSSNIEIPEDIIFRDGKLDLSVKNWTHESGRNARTPAQYEYSNIFSLEYFADNLPDNEKLEKHLLLFTKIYKHLQTIPDFPKPINLVTSEINEENQSTKSVDQNVLNSYPGIPSNQIPPTGGIRISHITDPSITPSNVYFARFGETDMYKIGRSRDPENRLTQLNEHIPNRDNEIPIIGRWKLLTYVPFHSEELTHIMEKDTLNWLEKFRTHDERVKCSDEGKIHEAISRLKSQISK